MNKITEIKLRKAMKYLKENASGKYSFDSDGNTIFMKYAWKYGSSYHPVLYEIPVTEVTKLINSFYSDRCEQCEVHSHCVEYQIEPFAEEIHGEEIWMHLCSECYYQNCQDI